LEAKDLKKVLALGMLGLLLAFAVALGTSATFRDYRAVRSVHIKITTDDAELIDLTPVQPYAYINGTGHLVIDFSSSNPNWPGHNNINWTGKGLGISPQSRYNFDEVFNVSNDLWDEVNITVEVISSDPNKITFYDPTSNMWKVNASGQPYNSDTSSGDVCFVLTPGEALGVGMELANMGLGDHNVEITIKAWPYDSAPDYLPNECGGGT